VTTVTTRVATVDATRARARDGALQWTRRGKALAFANARKTKTRTLAATAATAKGMSTEGLNAFLARAKETFRTRDAGTCDVVVGNEACDLDSVASALAYAYATSAATTTDGIVVPIVPCKADELDLRPDIKRALERAGVERESLLFADSETVAKTPKSVCLVDHNALSVRMFPVEWNERVTRVIDHHDDSGMYADEAERVIELIGSCSSLVYRDVLAPASESRDFKEVAQLLLSAIVLDTRFLDASTTRAAPVDFSAADSLRRVLDWSEADMRDEYEALSAARHDQSSFTCGQLLAKDYKQWKMGEFEVGIASFGVKLQDLIARQDANSIDAECVRFIDACEIDILFMMSSFEDEENNRAYTRQIAVTASASARGVNLDDVMGKLGAGTPLEKIHLAEGAPDALRTQSYRMGDVKASRKKVQPLLLDLFGDLMVT
jgi:exopolyphosphatase